MHDWQKEIGKKKNKHSKDRTSCSSYSPSVTASDVKDKRTISHCNRSARLTLDFGRSTNVISEIRRRSKVTVAEGNHHLQLSLKCGLLLRTNSWKSQQNRRSVLTQYQSVGALALGWCYIWDECRNDSNRWYCGEVRRCTLRLLLGDVVSATASF